MDHDRKEKGGIDVCEFGARAQEDEEEEGGLPPLSPSLSMSTALKAMTCVGAGNEKRRTLNLFGRRRNTNSYSECSWVSFKLLVLSLLLLLPACFLSSFVALRLDGIVVLRTKALLVRCHGPCHTIHYLRRLTAVYILLPVNPFRLLVSRLSSFVDAMNRSLIISSCLLHFAHLYDIFPLLLFLHVQRVSPSAPKFTSHLSPPYRNLNPASSSSSSSPSVAMLARLFSRPRMQINAGAHMDLTLETASPPSPSSSSSSS